MIDIVVDRFEGDFAVLEVDGVFVDWPVNALPAGTVEGSRLRLALGDHDDLDTPEERYDRLRGRSEVGTDIDL